MTLLEIINTVQRKLRETETAASNTTSYSKLIGQFVNEAKREVEDAWDWSMLRTSIDVTTANGTATYTFAGAGNRFRVLYDFETRQWNVWNVTKQWRLNKAPSHAWINQQALISPSQVSTPSYFSISGINAGDAKVLFWPIPDAIETIRFFVVAPQDDFLLDATEDAVQCSVPAWPVILGAYARAVSERGEDSGTLSDTADAEYRSALSDAIAYDARNFPEETTWTGD